jgi:hypothetical protein
LQKKLKENEKKEEKYVDNYWNNNCGIISY